jgi:hypothetical protein
MPENARGYWALQHAAIFIIDWRLCFLLPAAPFHLPGPLLFQPALCSESHPAGVINPPAIMGSTRSLLGFDQREPALRGFPVAFF